MIQLELAQLGHAASLATLHLSAGQLEFTARPELVLAQTQDDPQRLPVVIVDGAEVVGFFALSAGPHCDKYLSEPDPQAVALSALSVDSRQQGRGVGTAAMLALPAFLARPDVAATFPQARRVVLVVNGRNPAARRVYERAAFGVIGEREGPIGRQWVMAKSIW
ncbi:GNAT family N-acetyltransferase [Deinococcus sp.]|uniref:GNAT family N-acetyltransferase n=1 Tax=Deinococcus sp. TaxID=47478 RepID=UPI0025D4B925|nr:GNAT family N-acetyltransferase [Deinococcus sp.]